MPDRILRCPPGAEEGTAQPGDGFAQAPHRDLLGTTQTGDVVDRLA